jgi:predicted enzyme related to lactoylglutathione lyase
MTEGNEPIHVELVKYMLMVEDMARATAFYRDVIGLEVQLESPMWTELTCGDAIVALHGGGTGAHTKTGLSFQVSDLVSACQTVAAAGGRIVMEPEARPGEPIMLARLIDTEGNEFDVTQYVG